MQSNVANYRTAERAIIKMSWLGKLKKIQGEMAASAADPWRMRLERFRGRVDDDGFERVSTQTLLDLLEVPQHGRRPGTYRRLACLMTELGWTAVRVRAPTRGGYLEQVRGYCRDARAARPAAGGTGSAGEKRIARTGLRLGQEVTGGVYHV